MSFWFHYPRVQRCAIALAGLLGCGHGLAQTITTVPAALAPVPLDHPATLAVLMLALAALGTWMLRSRAGGHALRVLGATAVGLSMLAAAGLSTDLRAAIGVLQATFTAAGGQTLTIPIDPSPSPAAPTDFTPVEYTNQTGVPLRVSALTPPVSHTACFPGAIPSPLPATPLPPGATACAVGTQLAPGGACTVDVAALCAQAVAQTPGTVLSASPASMVLLAGGPSGNVTITNTGAAPAMDIAAQIPPGAGFTLSGSTCSGVLSPQASCTLAFLPGGSAEGPVLVMVVGSNTNALQISVSATAPAPAITAVDDTASVTEDAAAAAIDVLGNDTNSGGGAMLIASATSPANGTVVITGGGTGLTYQPNADYCNTPPGTALDSFSYTLTPGGSSASVSVSVACVNDAPVIVSNGGGATAAIDYPSLATTPVADVDATDADVGTTLVYSLAGGADQAAFAIDSSTGVLTFVTPPNAASPADSDADNVYLVTVQVSDGVAASTQALTITVGDPKVVAKRVVVMTTGETTNLDVRVQSASGDVIPGAPYSVNIVSGAGVVSVDANGNITPATTGVAQVSISSPGYTSWTAWISVRDIFDITRPATIAGSISNGDGFSPFGSNQGTPSTSYYADVFRIALTAGPVEIAIDTGDNLDSYLIMTDGEGKVVAWNDDDGDGVLGVGSRVRYTVTTPGVYFIEVSTFNGLDTGSYTMTVSPP